MGLQVMTVCGPVAPEALGVTLPHEHLLCDLRALWHAPPPERADLVGLVDADPQPRDRGPLSSDPYVCRPNLLLDAPALAAEELSYFRAAGGHSLVELTVQGLHPRPSALKRVAEVSGANVVAGCGWYRQSVRPPGLDYLSEDEMVGQLIRTIRLGFPGGVRPGIIGEIGTGDPVHQHERKALRAAAAAQRATGLSMAVHLALWGRQGGVVLDVLEDAGADLTRVMLCHLSEQPTATDYHRALLDRGACLAFDTFGAEYALDSAGKRLATDEERIRGLVRLIAAGYTSQLLVSHDICERLQLRAYGGYGYAHLLTTITPRLRRVGVDAATLDALFRVNPARLLAHRTG
jgi:phosphotriesterase-related protein